jgi:hypothetical protein
MAQVDSGTAASRIFKASQRWIKERTVALYRIMPEGNLVMVGSGVLLQIAHAAFVLSAGHVLEGLAEGAALVGPMTNKQTHLIRVSTPFIISKEDALDVGCFHVLSLGSDGKSGTDDDVESWNDQGITRR